MLRDLRRPSTRGLVRATSALALVGALSGCAGIGQPQPYDSPGINGLVIPTPTPDPDDFVDVVDNPWLPLEAGATWRYEVTDAGRSVGTISAEVLDDTTSVAGLDATGVRTTTDIDGDTTRETSFYAQDEDGNVWLVGADGDDDAGGVDWRAGENGAEAGLAMPAHPRLGDGWLAYVVPGLPEAPIRVEDQSQEMVQVLQTGSAGTGWSEAGATTRTVYEKGAGLVSVVDLDAGWVATRDRSGD
ncbi:hypothetical protein NOCD_07960 [Nocardioides cavernae]|uniref:hypothetical protein n=1 Tax=Nocardioides TaxID=1839 RepID=UPI0012E36DB9|nr:MULTISPECIES: hypothetical protein [Nocardioides]MCK9823409.1 hypothetical protein [Nocardioides cavernae]